MRTTMLLFSMLFVCVAAIETTWAQSPDRAARRRGERFGAKPGEIITPPDLSERWRDQLQVGQVAPDFTLPLARGVGDAVAIAARGKRNVRGKKPHEAKGSVPVFAEQKTGTDPGTRKGDSPRTVSLKVLREKKPVVLIFGSVTCPPFRSQLDGIDDVYRDFRDRANFLFVYIREAHPDSVLSLVDENRTPSLVKVPQPNTLEERTQIAATCGRTLELTMPIAVDAIDNSVGRLYAGWPNRMVVVGTDGRILFATDPSPRGTDAARLRAWLEAIPPKTTTAQRTLNQ